MNGRVAGFGEIMLRLAPPGFERFLQTPLIEAIREARGGNLITGAKTGDFQSITGLARRFIEAIREARA